MPKGLRRIHGGGDWHFITCSCYRRQQFLASARRKDFFLKILEEVRVKHNFIVGGYVVMPEHFHLLIQRAGTWKSFPLDAGTEAESFARMPEETKTTGVTESVGNGSPASVLAAAVRCELSQLLRRALHHRFGKTKRFLR